LNFLDALQQEVMPVSSVHTSHLGRINEVYLIPIVIATCPV